MVQLIGNAFAPFRRCRRWAGAAPVWALVCVGWLLFGGACIDFGTGLPPDANPGLDSETTSDTGGEVSETAETPVETVQMQGIKFIPEELTVEPGTEIVWEHHDSSTPHTLKSGTPDNPSGAWESSQMGGGDSYSRVFEDPGTYDYYCTQHAQGMQGTIEVVP